MKLTKLLLINLFVFFISLTVLEVIFGSWFEKDSFGPYMREHRLKKNPVVITLHSGTGSTETNNFIYKRNYHGFRGEEIDPSKIEAVFIGGSTADERYKPLELTISGNINTLLEEKGYKLKLTNAGIEGQSTLGHIFNFKHWFPKLKNFSPQVFIFYVGLNDIGPVLKRKNAHIGGEGHVINPEKMEVFFDNFKSRSFFYDKLRILKQKYYIRGTYKVYDHHYFLTENGKKKLNGYQYVNYEMALKKHDIEELKLKYSEKISNYLGRIETLNNYVKKMNALPIFINQVEFQGLFREDTFIVAYSLIEHCKERNLDCIDLAKKIDGSVEYWFDPSHTTNLGSKIIAETIIDNLVEILEKENIL